MFYVFYDKGGQTLTQEVFAVLRGPTVPSAEIPYSLQGKMFAHLWTIYIKRTLMFFTTTFCGVGRVRIPLQPTISDIKFLDSPILGRCSLFQFSLWQRKIQRILKVLKQKETPHIWKTWREGVNLVKNPGWENRVWGNAHYVYRKKQTPHCILN